MCQVLLIYSNITIDQHVMYGCLRDKSNILTQYNKMVTIIRIKSKEMQKIIFN